MSDKLVSVIIPVYNKEKYLCCCFDSIINQTYKSLEIILVNDGSSDSSPSICDEYARKDDRIQVIHNNNQGLYASRKNGFEHSTGENILFVDADDWLESTAIETLMDFSEGYEADIVATGIFENGDYETCRIPEFKEGLYTGSQLEEELLFKIVDYDGFYEFKPLPYLCNKLFRRNVIAPYVSLEPEKLYYINSVVSIWLAFANAKSIYISHGCYYHYRVVASSLKRRNGTDFLDFVRINYRYWIGLFKKDRWKNLFDKYLLYYLTFRYPIWYDEYCNQKHLAVFGGIPDDSRVIIYGAGVFGKNIRSLVEYYGTVKVVLWVDKQYGSYSDAEIMSPDLISTCNDYDYILVAVSRYKSVIEIVDFLGTIGVKKEKIKKIEKKVFSIPIETVVK